VLFCHVTSHVKDDPYQGLLPEKGGTGWPHLAFLDADGEVIGIHQGMRTVAAFQETGDLVRACLALQAKVAAGDDSARPDLLIARIRLGVLSYPDARGEADELELTEAQAKLINDLLFDMQVLETCRSLQQDPKGRESAKKIASLWRKQAEKGRMPMADQPFLMFWDVILAVADQEQDGATFRLAGKAFHERFAGTDNDGLKRVMERIDASAKKYGGDGG